MTPNIKFSLNYIKTIKSSQVEHENVMYTREILLVLESVALPSEQSMNKKDIDR